MSSLAGCGRIYTEGFSVISRHFSFSLVQTLSSTRAGPSEEVTGLIRDRVCVYQNTKHTFLTLSGLWNLVLLNQLSAVSVCVIFMLPEVFITFDTTWVSTFFNVSVNGKYCF